MERLLRKSLLLLLPLLLLCRPVAAEASDDAQLLGRVLSYGGSVLAACSSSAGAADSSGVACAGLRTNVYVRYYIKVGRRNVVLWAFPSMQSLAKGRREYAGETYNAVTLNFSARGGRGKGAAPASVDRMDVEGTELLRAGVLPRRLNSVEPVSACLMPNVYGVTLFDNGLLSPFHRDNTALYSYVVTRLTAGRIEVVFRPKRLNTRLISGRAIADAATGRIIRLTFAGEFDMVSFRVSMVMGAEGAASLMPAECDVDASFRFMGNRVKAVLHSVYATQPPPTPPVGEGAVTQAASDGAAEGNQSLTTDKGGVAEMSVVRPEPLPEYVRRIYDDHAAEASSKGKKTKDGKQSSVSQTAQRDVGEGNQSSTTGEVGEAVAATGSARGRELLTTVGGYVVSRQTANFGTDGRGAFRMSPILSPLSLGYSGRRGVTYRLKASCTYGLTANSDITAGFNAGYSFKQGQLYYSVPVKFNFNKRRNGYAGVEVGNGNRITNSGIVDRVKHENLDSIDWDAMNLDYFNDFNVRIDVNYDLTAKLSIRPGLMFHKRTAVDKAGFRLAGRPTAYYSLAPMMQLQFRPAGLQGPILTTDYERGIKAGRANMEYERFEADLSWIRRYRSLRSLSMRLGGGFYTAKGKDAYFLDYINFREENIPGGWGDNWTGEFQLLNSNWYNASEYYVRANVTYESPLMLLSLMPYIGRLMETERIYANMLFVEHLFPYIEYGYGFTNRYLSMGIFLATSNKKFEGFGCRVGVELFK